VASVACRRPQRRSRPRGSEGAAHTFSDALDPHLEAPDSEEGYVCPVFSHINPKPMLKRALITGPGRSLPHRAVARAGLRGPWDGTPTEKFDGIEDLRDKITLQRRPAWATSSVTCPSTGDSCEPPRSTGRSATPRRRRGASVGSGNAVRAPHPLMTARPRTVVRLTVFASRRGFGLRGACWWMVKKLAIGSRLTHGRDGRAILLPSNVPNRRSSCTRSCEA
jgi:hypothetical protein